MFRFISEFKTASKETKLFVFTVIFLGIIILSFTFFTFARLDFDRSYNNQEQVR